MTFHLIIEFAMHPRYMIPLGFDLRNFRENIDEKRASFRKIFT